MTTNTTSERLVALEAHFKPVGCPVCGGRPFVELLSDYTACGGPSAAEPKAEQCPYCGNTEKRVVLLQVVPSRKAS
jgi:hypothetical protein